MGIGWMWHVTRSDGPQGPHGLQAQNEYRAARFHARWRALCGWLEARVERRVRQRRAHALQHAFGRHPDALLQDIGLQRGTTGTIGPATPDPAPVLRPRGMVLQRCATCDGLPQRAAGHLEEVNGNGIATGKRRAA